MKAPRGFTLVELLMTLAIMAVIGSVAVPMMQISAQRDKERELRIALEQIRTAIDAYKLASEQGRIALKIGDTGYPPRLEDLVDGVLDARSPVKQKIHFLRRIPRDPFFPDGQIEASRTWRLRSYASSAAAPEPGKDVYDVMSTFDGIGLNGVAYARW